MLQRAMLFFQLPAAAAGALQKPVSSSRSIELIKIHQSEVETAGI